MPDLDKAPWPELGKFASGTAVPILVIVIFAVVFLALAERFLGQLCSELAYANIGDVIRGGLHEYLDGLQTKMNQVSLGIHDTFFARRMPEFGKKPMLQRNQ